MYLPGECRTTAGVPDRDGRVQLVRGTCRVRRVLVPIVVCVLLVLLLVLDARQCQERQELGSRVPGQDQVAPRLRLKSSG